LNSARESLVYTWNAQDAVGIMKDLIAEYKESQKPRFSIADAMMNSK